MDERLQVSLSNALIILRLSKLIEANKCSRNKLSIFAYKGKIMLDGPNVAYINHLH